MPSILRMLEIKVQGYSPKKIIKVPKLSYPGLVGVDEIEGKGGCWDGSVAEYVP
jgi:hypothetical protein